MKLKMSSEGVGSQNSRREEMSLLTTKILSSNRSPEKAMKQQSSRQRRMKKLGEFSGGQ